MCLPDFLIIGAEKAGTTSLYEYLKQHKRIYFPDGVKETHFFTHWKTDWGKGSDGYLVKNPDDLNEYKSLFEGSPSESLVGEASPSYLCAEPAVENIKDVLPEVKLIAILRNPVDRAFSNYLHVLRHWEEPLSFEEAVRNEEHRIEEGLRPRRHYKRKGMYAQQLKRYYAAFDRDQIHVMLSKDLWDHPDQSLRETLQFLGVDPMTESIKHGQHNASGIFRNPQFRRLYELLKGRWRTVKPYVPDQVQSALRAFFMERPEMQETVRDYLRAAYREEIRELEELIDRDLDHWLS